MFTNKVIRGKMKKITIITVVLNDDKNISLTIESVINQSFNNFEYIIIDGDSSDNTKNIIEKYLNHIDIFISEPDKGLFDAMNKGVTLSSGEYIIFLNSGDLFIDNEVLKTVEPYLNKEDFIYGDYKKYKENIKENIPIITENLPDLHCIPYSHQALFSKRQLLLEYPFNLNYKLAADFDHYMYWKKQKASKKRIPFYISYFQLGGISNKQRKLGIKENFKIAFYYNNSKTVFVYLLYRKLKVFLKYYLLKA